MAKSRGAGGRQMAAVPRGSKRTSIIAALEALPKSARLVLDSSANNGVTFSLEGVGNTDFYQPISKSEGSALYKAWKKSKTTGSPVTVKGTSFNGEPFIFPGTAGAEGIRYIPSPAGWKSRDAVLAILRK